MALPQSQCTKSAKPLSVCGRSYGAHAARCVGGEEILYADRPSFPLIFTKVKIALLHNPDAFRGKTGGSDLLRVFERAGHDVSYASTRELNWQTVVSDKVERAVIVGGDGTVQLIAPHLDGMPFSIVPSGTANNIAQCLHQTSSAESLASQLDRGETRYLDLGRV